MLKGRFYFLLPFVPTESFRSNLYKLLALIVRFRSILRPFSKTLQSSSELKIERRFQRLFQPVFKVYFSPFSKAFSLILTYSKDKIVQFSIQFGHKIVRDSHQFTKPSGLFQKTLTFKRVLNSSLKLHFLRLFSLKIHKSSHF
jgi:hypothetical protein